MLQACNQAKDVSPVDPWRDFLLGEAWPAVGERARFVEYSRAAGNDRLQHGWVLHDDAAAGAQRDRADDGDENSNQERARGCDHKRGQKSDLSPC
jgi:hypothetical protein